MRYSCKRNTFKDKFSLCRPEKEQVQFTQFWGWGGCSSPFQLKVTQSFSGNKYYDNSHATWTLCCNQWWPSHDVMTFREQGRYISPCLMRCYANLLTLPDGRRREVILGRQPTQCFWVEYKLNQCRTYRELPLLKWSAGCV